jgi:cell division protein FtsL
MSSASEAFEYAIRKDVRTIRSSERSTSRQREQWRSVALGVLFVGVLLFSGWQRVELLQHGYRLEQMQKERADESEVNRHLRLEIETLKSPQRIEALATRSFIWSHRRRGRNHHRTPGAVGPAGVFRRRDGAGEIA